MVRGPHGRWFDKLLGAIYAILAIVFALGIATLIKLARNQRTRAEGFLDYKLDARQRCTGFAKSSEN